MLCNRPKQQASVLCFCKGGKTNISLFLTCLQQGICSWLCSRKNLPLFLSLVATTRTTVYHFPLSVGAPLYLGFCFKSYYKLRELSKSSGEQERSHVSRCLPFLKLLSLQCHTAETSPEHFEEFQVLTHLPATELLLKTEPSPPRLEGSWEPKAENLELLPTVEAGAEPPPLKR